MGNENLLDIVYDLTASIEHVQNYKTNAEIVEYFAENGFDGEEIMEIAKFIEENLSEEEYEEALEQKSLDAYLSGLKRMRSYIETAKAYKEFTLEQNEEELWKNSEVDSSEVDSEKS